MPKLSLYALFLCLTLISFSSAAGFSTESSTSQFDIALNYDSYSVADGLSQNTVSSFAEDKSGYIWVGTVNGLNRFDGNEFKHFHADQDNGLPSSFVRNLLVDKDESLLVGTDKGLVRFIPQTESFETTQFQAYIGNKAIWSLSQFDNFLYIGMNNEMIVVDTNKNQVVSVVNDKSLKEIKKVVKSHNYIYIRNYDGELFLHSNNIITKVLDQTNDISNFEDDFVVSTSEGLFKIYRGELTKLSETVFYNFNTPTTSNTLIGVTSQEIFKILSNYKINKVGRTSVNLQKSRALYLSKNESKILASNIEDGFISISTINNLVKRVKPELNNIWSISKDDEYVYIATNESNIKKYDKTLNLIETYPFSNNEGPKYITVINENLYLGDHSGLFLMNNGVQEKISDDYITHLKTEGDKVIAGTFLGDILEYSDSKKTLSRFQTNLNYPIYDSLLIGEDRWIASQLGVYLINNNDIKTIFDKEITLSLSYSNGDIFFGTTKSLYSVSSSRPSVVKQVFNNNKAIYSTQHIDSFFITASAYEVNIISLINNSHIRLTEENGVLADYNIRSLLSIGEQILFGGTTGLSLIDINEVLSELNEQKSIKTNLKELLLFNTPVDVGSEILKTTLNTQDSIKLKYSDYPFTIKFSSVGRTYKTTDFYYILKGLDEEWIPAKGNNSATYTNLSSGEYTFSIYAVDLLTGQKGEVRNLTIIITPPWWASTNALVVYGFAIILISYLIFRALLRRRQVQKQIAMSEERLKLSLWGSGDEMWDWDIESGEIYRSNIWGTLDFPRDGRRSGKDGEQSNIHPLDQDRVQKALNDHFEGLTDHFEIAYRVKGRDPDWVWILDRAKIVERDQKELPLRMTGTIKNINKIKQAEEQLRLFARAIENISEGMFILDEKYQFVEVNEACCEISAMTREKFNGELLEFNRYPKAYSEQIRSLLKQHGRWTGEVEANRGDGTFFLMELTIDTIYNEQGGTSHYVGVFSDITRRKQQEEELRKLTNNDLLTGLPNRSSLQVTLSNLVKKDIHHTLMVLDVDNFKRINDSLGHQVGDDLLIGVADRIKMSIPPHASLYRLGGDEFALLIDQMPDIGSCAAIASKIIQSLSPSFEIDCESLVLGISIGIVLYPEDEQNEQALLRKADIAMYHAKSAGGNRYQFYSESLNQNALKQLEVENLIREALKEDYFEVYYQPKVDVKNDCLAGMEALVRLNHPTLGIIAPNDFIPLAEENGLIVEIGDVVLRKACFSAHKWLEQGIFSGRVAVNLSSRQFALPDLKQRIESILQLTKLPPHHLELEITEGTVIKNPENAIKVMQQLSKMGVSLALDDFGTGYSSLSYLKRFPINCLKIDKSFVDDIDKSDRDLKMVDSIITIAHNMGLSVVGEGVEQTAQLNILKALNCEEIQGYIYSKPIPEKDFSKLLITDTKMKHSRKQHK
ncbi:EAL domain-containing protein [Shewanella maritima]|uniref:EAL domain-containing protein n=1 Tax=Shewanella maritima TaxID=2520507 RepID=UPI003735475A